MNAETAKVKTKLAVLTASFDELESLLEPLFAQTLPETLVGLEPLQQAKLQTVLPYLVYDLIFIYLKSRGIDPKTHPVVPELERIREYFGKINNAENPPAKRTEIDKSAASRFIKHAIAQAQWKKTPAEEAQDSSTSAQSSSIPRIPAKVTQKMRDRAAYEEEIKTRDAEEDEEDELEVYNEDADGDDDDMGMNVDADPANPPTSSVAKGKGKEVTQPARDLKNKRRRPIDPFAGYGDEPSTTDSPLEPTSTSKKAKSSLIPTSSESSQQPTTTATPAPGTQGEKSKSKSSNKKTKKKAKKPTS